MGRPQLVGVRVAILAADGFEQVEVTRPMRQLLRHGAEVELISLRRGAIRGMNFLFPGARISADRTIFTADPDDYDALLIPGGFVNPDLLRQSRRVRDFVRRFDEAGKPIAAICHGPWVLISAGLVDGRRLTSWRGIRDDVQNAGGLWEDRSVVVDGNLLSSRGPHDLLQFNRAIVEHFSPERDAQERTYPLPLGALLLGGAAVALALGLRVRRGDRSPYGVVRMERTLAMAGGGWEESMHGTTRTGGIESSPRT